MMLTSLFLSAQGLTFSSVHDCYWTHASTVAEMNKVCRNQFVNLYKQPILEDLSEHFKKTYLQALNVDASQKNLVRAKLLFNDVPKKGSLDIDVVKDSVYFFSWNIEKGCDLNQYFLALFQVHLPTGKWDKTKYGRKYTSEIHRWMPLRCSRIWSFGT